MKREEWARCIRQRRDQPKRRRPLPVYVLGYILSPGRSNGNVRKLLTSFLHTARI